MAAIVYGEKVARDTGAWSQTVAVEGEQYRCVLSRGNPKRIAFKPRGTFGFHWFGAVYDGKGRQLWRGRVTKSTGVRGMLQEAGVVGLTKAQVTARIRLLRFSARQRARCFHPGVDSCEKCDAILAELCAAEGLPCPTTPSETASGTPTTPPRSPSAGD